MVNKTCKINKSWSQSLFSTIIQKPMEKYFCQGNKADANFQVGLEKKHHHCSTSLQCVLRYLNLTENVGAENYQYLFHSSISSQVTYVTMVPRVGNETLRPLGATMGNASSVTRA